MVGLVPSGATYRSNTAKSRHVESYGRIVASGAILRSKFQSRDVMGNADFSVGSSLES